MTKQSTDEHGNGESSLVVSGARRLGNLLVCVLRWGGDVLLWLLALAPGLLIIVHGSKGIRNGRRPSRLNPNP